MSNNNKMLEKEIIEFHNQQAKVANETSILDKMEANVIAKLCPFKKGDKVIFTERHNNKDYFGVVSAIYFNGINSDAIDNRSNVNNPPIINSIRINGINSDAIDNRWVIYVRPTTKNFVSLKDRWNISDKVLGKRKGDKIRKA